MQVMVSAAIPRSWTRELSMKSVRLPSAQLRSPCTREHWKSTLQTRWSVLHAQQLRGVLRPTPRQRSRCPLHHPVYLNEELHLWRLAPAIGTTAPGIYHNGARDLRERPALTAFAHARELNGSVFLSCRHRILQRPCSGVLSRPPGAYARQPLSTLRP